MALGFVFCVAEFADRRWGLLWINTVVGAITIVVAQSDLLSLGSLIRENTFVGDYAMNRVGVDGGYWVIYVVDQSF